MELSPIFLVKISPASCLECAYFVALLNLELSKAVIFFISQDILIVVLNNFVRGFSSCSKREHFLYKGYSISGFTRGVIFEFIVSNTLVEVYKHRRSLVLSPKD